MKRKCKKCGIVKLETEFYMNSPSKTLRYSCKTCQIKYQNDRYKQEKDKVMKEREAKRLRFEELLRNLPHQTYGPKAIQRHVE